MSRSRRRGRGACETHSGSGEDSFVAVVVTKLTGALLIILVMTMGIMVLLPQGLAELRRLMILSAQEGTAELPGAMIGQPYQFTFATEGGNEFIDFELVEGAFPPGLRWIERSHQEILTETQAGHLTKVGIQGTPLGPAGRHEFTVRARSTKITDKMEENQIVSEPKTFVLAVAWPSVLSADKAESVAIVTDSALPPTRLDSGAASAHLTAKGGVGPYAWRIEKSSAPLTIDADGRLAVVSKSPAVIQFTASATSFAPDALRRLGKEASASKSFVWRLLPPHESLAIVTPKDLPAAEAGKPSYRVALAARGGAGAYSWSLLNSEKGQAPPPFVKIEHGYLLAAPAMEDRDKTYEFQIQVADGSPESSPVIGPARLRVESPSLIRAAPSDPASVLKIRTKEQLPDAVARSPFGVMFAAEGGRPPYLWTLENVSREDAGDIVSMPELGLRLEEGGWLSGSPRLFGKFRLVVGVHDSPPGGVKESSDRRIFVLTVNPAPTINVSEPLKILTPPKLPDARAGEEYRLAFSAKGGAPPYLWSFVGNPPKGVRFLDSMAGVIGGKPNDSAVGSHEFMVAVADRRGNVGAQRLKVQMTVLPASPYFRFLAFAMPDAVVGRPYAAVIPTAGGSPPFEWRITEGGLPAELKFDPETGAITGTITELPEKIAEFTVQVMQADGQSKQGRLTLASVLSLERRPLAIGTPEKLPPAQAGETYQTRLVAEGGAPPYSWKPGAVWPERTAGGLSLSENGAVSSSAPFFSAKTLRLEAVVTDSANQSASQTFLLSVSTEPIQLRELSIVSNGEMPTALVDRVYRFAPAADGGLPPYKWTLLNANALPQGLQFVNSNALEGSPISASAAPIALQLQVEDAQVPPASAAKTLTLSVLPKPGPIPEPGVARIWWMLAGFLGICLLYAIIDHAGLQSPARQTINVLVRQGLIIVQSPQGNSLDGPAHLQGAYRKCITEMLQKRMSLQIAFALLLIVYIALCVFVIK